MQVGSQMLSLKKNTKLLVLPIDTSAPFRTFFRPGAHRHCTALTSGEVFYKNLGNHVSFLGKDFLFPPLCPRQISSITLIVLLQLNKEQL
jgi:hypothetical protein